MITKPSKNPVDKGQYKRNLNGTFIATKQDITWVKKTVITRKSENVNQCPDLEPTIDDI